MAEFILNDDSKNALQLGENGRVIAIETLTSELRKCTMQFLSVLFSFGRYSYIPCPKENEPLYFEKFLLWFTSFYSNEYCENGSNHKHVRSLFESYPDSFYVDFLTGKSVWKRLVVSIPETKQKQFVLIASKKGADSIKNSIATTGIILNNKGIKEPSFGSSKIQLRDCTTDLEKPLQILSFFANGKFHIKLIIRANSNFNCGEKLSPQNRAIYEVFAEQQFSGFNNAFIKNVDERYKKLIDKDSPKYNRLNERLIEWKRNGKLADKIKDIISGKINHQILEEGQPFYVIRKIELEKQGNYIIPINWLTR